MKKAVFIALSLLLAVNGCVPLIVGGSLVTGFIVGTDSAVGNIETEYRILWDLCKDKLEAMEAEIVYINESKGRIKAVVSENSVMVAIDVINPSLQKLKVSARRCYIPKPHFAQKVFLRIIEGL